MFEVPLRPGLPGGRWACLRELRGRDEALATGSPEMLALQLIDRLLVEVDGTTVRPGTAADLAICDRDRLLAAIYVEHFGPRVEGTRRCGSCGEVHEVGFVLPELLATLQADAVASTRSRGPATDGSYQDAAGHRFRLPSTRDRRAVMALPAQEARRQMLAACRLDDLRDGEGDDDADAALEAAMEEVGPILSLELDGSCPACGASEPLRFDILDHLAGVMALERRFLNREIHCLARAYGWGLGEILDLARSDRRAFVTLNEPPRDEAWG
jgi:hypothetical protein